MRQRSEARILSTKALASLRRALQAFNGHDDDGRTTTVLLNLQHSFEMLLKATLVQRRFPVFDKKTGRSIGFEGCIRQAEQHKSIKLTREEAGTLRVLDALRDDEQHWFNVVDEGLLYIHTRAAVTLFDDLLQRCFQDRLASHLPHRVLPIGIEAPQEFTILVDREYKNITDLLKPGRRRGADARARIRSLLAMEAHTDPDTKVSQKDVARVERAIREGKARSQVFPKLASVGTHIAGGGLQVEVRFVKQGGVPVRVVRDGETAADHLDIGAYREVDLQKKYHWSGFELSDKLGLTRPRGTALRAHLGIDGDERFWHVFKFGSQVHPRYSDNAYTSMRDALADGIDMDAVWAAHGPRRKAQRTPPCGVAGCLAIQETETKAS